DRKSTRLNSSHVEISYAVFCLKKSEEHTSELQSRRDLVCRLLLEKKIRAEVHAAGARGAWRLKDAAQVGRDRLDALVVRRPPVAHKPVRRFFLMNRVPPESTLFPHPGGFR